MAETDTLNTSSTLTGANQRTITAFFDSRSEVDNAVDRLIEAGLSPDHVRLVPGNERDPDIVESDVDTNRGVGFWDSLKDLFLPDEDRHAYAEGLSRGGFLVTATAPDALYDRALDILDDEGTIDIGERETEWRQGGWTGYTGQDYRASGPIGAATGMAPTATNMGTPGVDLDGDTAAYDTKVSGVDSRTAGIMGADASGSAMASPTIPDSAVTGAGLGTSMGIAGRDVATSGGTAADLRSTESLSDETYAATDTADLSRSRVGGSAYTGAATTDAARTATTGDDYIPLAEEQLRVGKRDVSHGRVRVRSYVVETPVEEQVRLREERVNLDRRAVDRPATDADQLFRERSIELEERAEEALVSKDVRVREEVRLGKEANERVETVSDTVRRTELDVQDERGQSVGGTAFGTERTAGFGGFASEIREHMDVIASDGQLIGKVDKLEGERIKLTKNDAPDGQHHYLPLSAVDHVDTHVHLTMSASQAKAAW